MLYFHIMKSDYWSDWNKYLTGWGLKPLACTLLRDAKPLLPLISQVMSLGLPLFKGIPFSAQYQAVVETLGDEDGMDQFYDYLQGVRG